MDVWHWKLFALVQILLGGFQPSFLLLSHGEGKLRTNECLLSYTHTQLQIVHLVILKSDLYHTEMDKFCPTTPANPLSPGRFMTRRSWLLPSSGDKVRSSLWNFWECQIFPEMFHIAANLMALLIANGCSFPKGCLRMFFWFDEIRGSAMNIFRSWELVTRMGYKNHFSVWCTLTFWSTRHIRQKGGNAYSNFFDQFVALHLCPDWMDLTSMHCIE